MRREQIRIGRVRIVQARQAWHEQSALISSDMVENGEAGEVMRDLVESGEA